MRFLNNTNANYKTGFLLTRESSIEVFYAMLVNFTDMKPALGKVV